MPHPGVEHAPSVITINPTPPPPLHEFPLGLLKVQKATIQLHPPLIMQACIMYVEGYACTPLGSREIWWQRLVT